MVRPVLIVPGLNGSTDDHWQSHWLRDDPSARLVMQPDWGDPKADVWLSNLEQAIAAAPGALIVAHSLGSMLTTRLASRPSVHLVGGALLVAPADIERTSTIHARHYDFGMIPIDPLPFPALVAASRNDPYMPFERMEAVAAQWQVPVMDMGEAGHINIDSGFGRWPRAYALGAQIVSADVAPMRSGQKGR